MSGIELQDFYSCVLPDDLCFRQGSRHLAASEVLNAGQAALQQGQIALEVSAPVSFSGMLINRRAYPGKHVKKAAPSYTKPFEKPLLTHHDDFRDPIGRVKKASYTSTVDAAVLDALGDVYPPTEEGSGVLDATFHVVDPDAIPKVLDERYKTLSVQFNTESLTCSVCNKDLLQEGWCGHEPGRVYEVDDERKKGKKVKRLAYYVTGPMAYGELSFVNKPGAKQAIVKSVKPLSDALAELYEHGVDEGYEPRQVALCLDALTLGTETYQILRARDREVIEVAAASSPDVAETPDPGAEVEAREGVPEASVLPPTTLPDQSTAEGACQGNDMSEDTAAMPPTGCPDCADKDEKLVQLGIELHNLGVDKKQLDERFQALLAENQDLASRVHRALAERLVELRQRTGHPGAKDLDAEARGALVDRLAERSRASLEDAIADEELRQVPAAEAPAADQADEPPAPQVIERGSVTAQDAGVKVAPADHQATPQAPPIPSAKPLSPVDYRAQVLARFKVR